MLDSTTPIATGSFVDLLRRLQAAQPVATEDVVRAVRALLDEVRELHEAGNVAELDRIDLLVLSESGELHLGHVPTTEPSQSMAIAAIETAAATVVDRPRRSSPPGDRGNVGAADLSIADPDEVPQRPMFYPGYASWERALGHHDALTDIFHLGMLIGSVATGLDFRLKSDLAAFVQHRTNLARLRTRLHPVIARVIADMTEPLRASRAADLSALIDLIDGYRIVEVDDAKAKAGDLAALVEPGVRRRQTQAYFRNRLFEVTRRNKLLYFMDRHGVDLTRGSFPFMLNYRTLQPRQLLTTTPEFLQRLAALHVEGEPSGELDLRRNLQCSDYPFLAPAIDKVRAGARKDLRELGFNQLRLVLAFLRWHDDDRAERINTPLVMVPVTLKRQPGTVDGFSLSIEGAVAEAEVNPVLRYIMAERFQIALPETLDLRNLEAIDELSRRLEREVGRSRPGLSIGVIAKPRVQLLQKTVNRELDDYRRRQKRAGLPLKDWRGVSYSYTADNYQPLGFELFDRFIRARPAPGRELAGSDTTVIDTSVQGLALPGLGAAPSTSTEQHAPESSENGGPLNWEIDLCAITLANFNTRKMSLVRDYEELLGGYAGGHANYSRVFENGGKPALATLAMPGHTERSFVLPSDTSQDEAILRAATGESYVIQGPPGTGKSQTIANLLADLAAKGKSVLFVCEKRVALDVVHNRLKEAGIGDLACQIHNVRDDRQAFIADLKALYEEWMVSRAVRTARDRRTKLGEEIEALIGRLAAFSHAMRRPLGNGRETIRSLMGRAIAGSIAPIELSAGERDRVPGWDAFCAGEAALADLEQRIAETGLAHKDIQALLRVLHTGCAEAGLPTADLEAAIGEARRGLEVTGERGASANDPVQLFRVAADVAPDRLAPHSATLDAIKAQAADLARHVDALEQVAPELAAAWRELCFDLDGFRAAALHTSIDRMLECAPDAQQMTAADLQRIADDLGDKLAELRQLNAKRTLEEQKARFRQRSTSGDDSYDAGRAFLEHQFSLQRPSATMRDFLSGDPALVVRDLKPIWMMSPLSVADTLPLNEALFDVVVFDEASQIPIEDAVPTLYRAPQSIVVGDEMQLPPPSYFARRLDSDEMELPDYIAFGMQAESLLDKAVVALPSTRLDWHYRSRHEGLIGFCNQAFYGGGLKTIPSREVLAPAAPVDATVKLSMSARAALVLSRPIGFHKIFEGAFAGQQNLKEAAYVADLVRALLSEKSELSIGIVAFSQPQQAAIETALERLANENQTFRNRLDKARGLEQEELFVKNLENVQGDERDIMIVSIAYAPGPNGRMVMNFGPINQEGGEKRLNVIFSRAKHHVVVVTSIDPDQITNDWNKGANALKRYMMYAAAASVGDAAGMRAALSGYPGAEHVDRVTQLPDPLADAITAAQFGNGREAVRGLGQSTARCDVAIKERGALAFTTAILTDNDTRHDVSDVVDRYVTYPALLRASGWQVEFALAKDWLAKKAS